MNKLEAMLEYLYKKELNDIDWLDVAFNLGLATNHTWFGTLKKTIGLTPNTYAKEGGLTIDVYGGVRVRVTNCPHTRSLSIVSHS